MATYPSAIYAGTSVAGTTLVSDVDHAANHNGANNELTAIEIVLGTTAGTSVLKNFAGGDFSARINSSNVLQQRVSGTLDNGVFGTPAITSGTVANASIGTPTIIGGTILGSGTVTPISIGVNLAPTVGTLSDASGGTIFANAQAASLFEITLGTNATNRTLGTPQNPTNGQAITYRIKQNAAGVGTVLWASVFRFSSNVGTPTLGTAATWNYFGWRYNSGDVKWDFVGQSLNVI